ncbi:uncharacterized protein [Panulirus ornatus]|uniref:uncharacterized protein isoform X2 n=1 Tax=Panulirus ornatus TaxID=150431 RepID=UPI003A856B9E
MADDISLPWPSGIPQLKRLDELLRCGICYEFLSTSMITACSHNYCSICIRQYLTFKTQCPACFQETTSQHLRNNRLLDEIIGLFPALRDKVARLNRISKGNVVTSYLETRNIRVDTKEDQAAINTCNSGQFFTSPKTPRNNQLEDEERASPKQISSPEGLQVLTRNDKDITATPKRNVGKIFSPRRSSTPLGESKPEPCSSKSSSSSKSQAKLKSSVSSLSQSSSYLPSTQSTSQTSAYFSVSGNRSINNESSSEQDGTCVPCPVCGVEVPERNINLHLDACLQRIKPRDDIEIIEQSPKRKPLPKLVYSLLSDKQMRQKLKEIGLSVQGDKQSLVNRHRRYTTLYNAECDVAEPCPVSDLVRQVEREEREKARGTSSQSIFTYDRKSAPEVIEKEQKNYLKKNNKHFAKLIDEVRKRHAQRRENNDQKCEVQDEKVICGQMSKDTNACLISNEICSSVSHDGVLNDNPKLNECKEDIEKNMPCSIDSSMQWRENTVISDKIKNDSKNELKRKEILGTPEIDLRGGAHTDLGKRISKEDSLHHSAEDEILKPLKEVCSSERLRDRLLPDNKQSDEKPVHPSPDIFLASPSSSVGSEESVSLLQDCEPLTPPQLASLSGHLCESDEEELIPAHQPETHHDIVTEDTQEVEQPSSQQVNMLSMPANKSPQDLHHPSLTDQGDVDYISSQLVEVLESEDIDFYVPRRRTRQSSRKRKSVETEVTSQRVGRKRKK